MKEKERQEKKLKMNEKNKTKFKEKQTITIVSRSESDLIYYSFNENKDFIKYEKPIEINNSTKIFAYSVREYKSEYGNNNIILKTIKIWPQQQYA